ncbi:3,4-dihydroxyphenylacetate 2,3-dioxygenase [Bosea sp. 685]|uniref:3,4-dihydroxyphenylacetate 2,3-dioxygenase n=1 Tax=Bosea sp. 685 TaxID=3080057 RepID=UPI002893032C|nr:3,4-dihydroxyphenylacetate 2,3-dioxygenase [Bosea sp. 685]WNJ87934.1 3,4-dihydroxyphenylacetate 2,3-dioxygenase [Bosea sp. 685]
MGIPEARFDTPFNIARLSHATLYVRDLARSRRFYADTLGLLVTAETPDAIYLRGFEERNHHSLVLVQSESPAVGHLGYKVHREGDLERLEAFLDHEGRPTTWVDLPFQDLTLRTIDPQGIPIEFYHRMDRVPTELQRYAKQRGGKLQRIDHFNCFTNDLDGSLEFYHRLGFRTTEYTVKDGTDTLLSAWLQRRGTTHDLAFALGAGPRLHHVAFWVANPLNIIDLLDLMATTGYQSNIERGPGRHGISNAFFLYVRDPDGHRVEIFNGDYSAIDHDHEPLRWQFSDPLRSCLWGPPAPRSWIEEGSIFLGQETHPPKTGADVPTSVAA